MISLKQHKSYN